MSVTELKDPSDIEDELWNVHERTRTNGNIMAEVVGYHRTGDNQKILIEYKLPNGNSETEKFLIPQVNSDEFEFVRLLNKYGYDLTQISELPGTPIELSYSEGEYEIVIPELKKPLRERMSLTISHGKRFFHLTAFVGGMVFLPVGWLWFVYWNLTSDEKRGPGKIDPGQDGWVIVATLGIAVCLFWVGIAWSIVGVL